MVASFSPHRDTGGTLHLVSPSGIHHAHTSSALNQLRRSLSRSPSKGSDFRLFSPSRLHSSSAKKSHLFSASLSPSRRSSAQNSLFLVPTSNNGTSTVALSHQPSSRVQRPGMRRNGSLQSSRIRANPSSPAKRVLSESRDQGNAAPPAQTATSLGTLDSKPKPELSPVERIVSEGNPINGCTPMEEVETSGSLTAKPGPSRVEKRRSGTFGSLMTSSPLKRSDGVLNLDQVENSNPSAKRRSLHGATSVPDFDIFDCKKGNADSAQTAASNMENEPPPSIFSQTPTQASTIPERSSSLRKSTLQQRQIERPLFSRARSQNDGASDTPTGTPMVLRSRQRMSFDSGTLASPARDTTYPSGPSTSSSLFGPCQTNGQAQHTAHPLSRTITQLSSSSSFVDDSPTHEPVINRSDGGPRPILNFSKSLPAGTARPLVPSQLRKDAPTPDPDPNYATPDSYKFVKPLPAAFMSTGLISKKNRDIADLQNASIMSKNMPDTPCKRTANLFPIRKIRPPPSAVKPKPNNTPSHSWTPLNPPPTVESGTPLGKSVGIFGSSFAKPPLSRRSSFVSLDGDDQSQSPSAQRYTRFTIDSDLPPTPTKQASWPYDTHASRTKSAFDFLSTPEGPSSSPLNGKSNVQASPRTPQEHILPPDPSGLSISARNDHASNFADSHPAALPATPTGPRELFPQFGKRHSLSLSGYSAPDVDPCLTSRFDKVELIGTGEFSQVYRVTERESTTPFGSPFCPATAQTPQSNGNSRRERVWAVKKSKQPYSGAKDRARRNNEVEVLKALGSSDYVISFADSWEHQNHLYIQTEFCEEGSLDVFLAQVGLKARLDDFRIWKILLELSLGLKHVHDSGFIHLDLKPANILITFEGVLKIADFGMATRWPAAPGIEGEGDREYIGPEVLMGQFDKPADIFSLGLIMFETAGNVELPDNGVSWQKLRNGDMSDVPSLTWSSETSNIPRDASGNPLPTTWSFDQICGSDEENPHADKTFGGVARSGELAEPPSFMVDPNHEQALDKLVRWMISPNPADRPKIDDVLASFGVQWAEKRRRAGATIYEGNWGPADEVLAEDAEMIDV
ncbi:hypothetical protein VTO42DRAFT_5146 [Malbranchea cinnamomea]